MEIFLNHLLKVVGRNFHVYPSKELPFGVPALCGRVSDTTTLYVAYASPAIHKEPMKAQATSSSGASFVQYDLTCEGFTSFHSSSVIA